MADTEPQPVQSESTPKLNMATNLEAKVPSSQIPPPSKIATPRHRHSLQPTSIRATPAKLELRKPRISLATQSESSIGSVPDDTVANDSSASGTASRIAVKKSPAKLEIRNQALISSSPVAAREATTTSASPEYGNQIIQGTVLKQQLNSPSLSRVPRYRYEPSMPSLSKLPLFQKEPPTKRPTESPVSDPVSLAASNTSENGPNETLYSAQSNVSTAAQLLRHEDSEKTAKLETALSVAQQATTEAERLVSDLRQELQDLKLETRKEAVSIEEAIAKDIQAMRREHQAELNELRRRFNDLVDERDEVTRRLGQLKVTHEQEVKQIRMDSRIKLDEVRDVHAEGQRRLETDCDRRIEKMQEIHAARVRELVSRAEEQASRVQRDEDENETAKKLEHLQTRLVAAVSRAELAERTASRERQSAQAMRARMTHGVLKPASGNTIQSGPGQPLEDILAKVMNQVSQLEDLNNEMLQDASSRRELTKNTQDMKDTQHTIRAASIAA